MNHDAEIKAAAVKYVRETRRRWIRVNGIKRRGDLALVLCRDDDRNEEFAMLLERSRWPGAMAPTWDVTDHSLEADDYRRGDFQ